MVILSEMLGDGAVSRPRQFALVGLEFPCELIIYFGFRLRRRCRSLLALRRSGSGRSLRNDPGNLFVEGLDLTAFFGYLLLIFFLVPVQLVHYHPGILLVALELVHQGKVPVPLGNGLLPKLFKGGRFLIKLSPGFLDLLRLTVHFRRDVFQISVPPDSLAYIVAGKYVHVPDPRVPVLVRASHETGIIKGKGIETGLYPLYFLTFC